LIFLPPQYLSVLGDQLGPGRLDLELLETDPVQRVQERATVAVQVFG